MAGSKFRGLLNKGKQRNKVEVPVPEPVAFEQHEVEDLLASLNDTLPATVEEALAKVEYVEEKVEEKRADPGTFVAYGIAYDEKKKKYMKISIDYNPVLGYSNIRSIEDWADDPNTALFKLNKIISLKLLKKEEKY